MSFFDEVGEFLDKYEGKAEKVIEIALFVIPLFAKLLKKFGLSVEDIDLEAGTIRESGWQKLEAKGISRDKIMAIIEESENPPVE